MTAGVDLLPAGYNDMSVYRFAMEKEEQLYRKVVDVFGHLIATLAHPP